MKTFFGYPGISVAVVVLVAAAVLFSGCTQPAGPQTPLTTGSPAGNSGQGTPAPVGTGMNTALPYGVNISVPADWTRQDILAIGVRDYGTTTVNIANFYSPDAIPGDPASYTSLSIDVDQNPGADFEKYFNNATLAVGLTYGVPIQMEAHSYTITVSGYKSYELDFQTAEVKGTYIFTSTENGMYIFAFKVPNKPPAVQAFQGEIVGIYQSIRINPPIVEVPRHR
jgi:hypothetical protein